MVSAVCWVVFEVPGREPRSRFGAIRSQVVRASRGRGSERRAFAGAERGQMPQEQIEAAVRFWANKTDQQVMDAFLADAKTFVHQVRGNGTGRLPALGLSRGDYGKNSRIASQKLLSICGLDPAQTTLPPRGLLLPGALRLIRRTPRAPQRPRSPGTALDAGCWQVRCGSGVGCRSCLSVFCGSTKGPESSERRTRA